PSSRRGETSQPLSSGSSLQPRVVRYGHLLHRFPQRPDPSLEMTMPRKSIAQLFDLTGKTAVITGGSMGIGRGIAQRLSEAGATVVIADVAEQQGNACVAELTTAEHQAYFIKADVSSEADVQAL